MTKQNFYGWKIVWAILVQLTFTSGLSFYNHAIYLNALAAQPSFDVQSDSRTDGYLIDFTLDEESFKSITSHIKPSKKGGKKKKGKKKKKKK